MTMPAHPTHLPRRIPHHEGVIRDILRHNRTRRHKRVTADRDSANYRRICPDGAPALQMGALIQRMTANLRARIRHVREHARRPEKYVIINDNPGVDRDVVLYLNVIADYRAAIDVDVLPDDASRADPRS